MATRTIDIRPTSSVYATYRRLSYKPWHAVAEFVDNSTQSFVDHMDEIHEADGDDACLEVRVYHDKEDASLTVTDNAFGMGFEDFTRAIQLNKPPTGAKTRNEFGMGLKTAASWMGAKWSVTSKALGSTEEFSASVDVDLLAADEPEGIHVAVRDGRPKVDHYTTIHVERMFRLFQTRTSGKIKELLGSMYRRDLATGKIRIFWNDEPLQWDDDPIFVETLPDKSPLEWKTNLEFEVEGHRVTGWAAVRFPGSGPRAGFALFRKGRIILGGPHLGWKPDEIFRHGTSFERQRIIGELDLDTFPVTQAKDGFDWDGGLEDALVAEMKPRIQGLLDRAVGSFKADKDGDENEPHATDARLAIDTVAADLVSDELGQTVEFLESAPPTPDLSPEEQEQLVDTAVAAGIEPTVTSVGSAGIPTVKWYLLDDEHPKEEYVRLAAPSDDVLHVFLNLRHPFMEEHVGSDQSKLILYMKMVLADALVERAVGRRPDEVRPAMIRQFKDAFLRKLPSENL